MSILDPRREVTVGFGEVHNVLGGLDELRLRVLVLADVEVKPEQDLLVKEASNCLCE